MSSVSLRVYNIGMEPFLSILSNILNKKVDALYHTSIVVYDTEYYFQGGICASKPGETSFGIPIREHNMGETEMDKESFEIYLKNINELYTEETYHIVRNNCNHFTDTMCEILLDKRIPEYILEIQELAAGNEQILNIVNMFYSTK